MSINIYPAFMKGREIIHADNWDDESTMNLANGNFYGLMEMLGLPQTVEAPGHIKLTVMEKALDTAPWSRYNSKLLKLCAIARVKGAQCIAYA
jgi:hypothetical protein